mmetsp:Transcript_29076/g.64218  ORF Transcript_29076/g.64218 Transcript_29076/m.64218 type:complete len:204 (+) Transcript_29076:445-1056(+)
MASQWRSCIAARPVVLHVALAAPAVWRSTTYGCMLQLDDFYPHPHTQQPCATAPASLPLTNPGAYTAPLKNTGKPALTLQGLLWCCRPSTIQSLGVVGCKNPGTGMGHTLKVTWGPFSRLGTRGWTMSCCPCSLHLHLHLLPPSSVLCHPAGPSGLPPSPTGGTAPTRRHHSHPGAWRPGSWSWGQSQSHQTWLVGESGPAPT